MKLISFVFFKSYYYFLVYWILDFVVTLIKYFFENNIKNNENSFSKENEYIYLITMNVADLLAGFLVLYTKINTKSEKEEKKIIKKSKYELIYNDLSIKENKYLYIFVISLLDLIGRSADFLYILIIGQFIKSIEKLQSTETMWLISIDIISRIIFSKIILKTKILRHHCISTIIFVIGFLPMTIFGIIYIKDSSYWYHILFLIPKNILFAFEDTLSKILLTNKFVLPHYLLFWKGIFNFGMHVILFPILFFTDNIDFIDSNGNNFFSSDNLALKIVMRILNISLLLLKGLCIMKVIYLFSPQHVCFLNVVNTLSAFVLSHFLEKGSNLEVFDIITNIIALIIIIFGTLLFNEIIIVNICGLNRDTKTNILEREKLELLEIDSSNISDKEGEESIDIGNITINSENENT